MTRALILAAGQGTRLRPHTDTKPKAMVEFAGTPLLTRQINTLKSAGIEKIQMATGYLADVIKKQGYETSYNPHFDQTNMVESLFSARDFIKQADGEDLLICYGDIIYQQNNLNTVLNLDSEVVLMIDMNWREYWSLRLENPLEDAETLKMDKAGNVLELGKKPQSYDEVQGQYTGLIKIRHDKIHDFVNFYDRLDREKLYDGKDFKNMYMTSFLQSMINAGWEVKAAKVKNGWLEIDTVEDLALYQEMQDNGRLQKFYDIGMA